MPAPLPRESVFEIYLPDCGNEGPTVCGPFWPLKTNDLGTDFESPLRGMYKRSDLEVDVTDIKARSNSVSSSTSSSSAEHCYGGDDEKQWTGSGENSPTGSGTSPTSAGAHLKTSLYKTELCKRFTEYGSCRYGAKCQFAHGGHELRSIKRHPKYKTVKCRSFWTTGRCPYGQRCKFLHDEVTSDPGYTTTVNRDGSDSSPSERRGRTRSASSYGSVPRGSPVGMTILDEYGLYEGQDEASTPLSVKSEDGVLGSRSRFGDKTNVGGVMHSDFSGTESLSRRYDGQRSTFESDVEPQKDVDIGYSRWQRSSMPTQPIAIEQRRPVAGRLSLNVLPGPVLSPPYSYSDGISQLGSSPSGSGQLFGASGPSMWGPLPMQRSAGEGDLQNSMSNLSISSEFGMHANPARSRSATDSLIGSRVGLGEYPLFQLGSVPQVSLGNEENVFRMNSSDRDIVWGGHGMTQESTKLQNGAAIKSVEENMALATGLAAVKSVLEDDEEEEESVSTPRLDVFEHLSRRKE